MESAFQFTNPSLIGLEFGANEEYSCSENKEVNITINMSVKVEKKDGRNEAKVSLTAELGEKGGVTPFYVTAIECADFRWKENLDEEKVDKLLNQNAPSLLLSYLRPVISQLTGASPFGAVNIPFMNFTNQE